MLNKVSLIGRLGNDPELRYMPNGGAVANLSLATSRRWKDKQSGERKEETEWHRVVLFQRLAEIAGEYLRKGSLVHIEGRIRTRKFVNKAGFDQYSTEIMGEQLLMLDSKQEGATSSRPAAQAPSSADQSSPQPAPSDLDDFDDVPF